MSSTELLTSAQAAAIIGCSAKTVLRRAEAGTLPIGQRLPGPNGHFLFHRTDVEAHRDEVAQRRASKAARRSTAHVAAVSA